MSMNPTTFSTFVDDDGSGTTGTLWNKAAVAALFQDQRVCDGRLTLTSGTPITTADVTSATTIYFSPYRGNRIALYNGTIWSMIAFSDTSVALGTITASVGYDVFAYNNGGALALELHAWASASARATALVLQDGVLVKSGATTRRYLGAFYTSSTTQTGHAKAKRYVSNYYNRARFDLQLFEPTTSWPYTVATWRQARATATNQVEVFIGHDDALVDIEVAATYGNGSGVNAQVAIGLDSTTTPATSQSLIIGPPVNGTNSGSRNRYVGYPGIGWHRFVWLEFSTAVGTTTWYSAGGLTANNQSGLLGSIEA